MHTIGTNTPRVRRRNHAKPRLWPQSDDTHAHPGQFFFGRLPRLSCFASTCFTSHRQPLPDPRSVSRLALHLTCARVSASAPDAFPGTVRRPCGLLMTTMSSSWKIISNSLVTGAPPSLPSFSCSVAPASDMLFLQQCLVSCCCALWNSCRGGCAYRNQCIVVSQMRCASPLIFVF